MFTAVVFASGVAYLVPTWQDLFLCMILFGLMTSLVFISLPESPHWLVSKGKVAEANKVLKTLVNGKKDFLKEKDTLKTYLKKYQ